MTKQTTNLRESVAPTDADTKLAQESSRRLTPFVSPKHKKPLRVHIESLNESDEAILIPVSAIRLLNGILTEMAKGNAVSLIPIQAELTTRQAADILSVSRPFLIDQMEKGLIPFRKVGSHRRVMFNDLMEYKQSMNQHRLQALEELSALDQELELGY